MVLIIGILAAIALPQYQKAVYRSRLNTVKNLVISITNAQEVYYLSNNSYAISLDLLDIDLPIEEEEKNEYGWYVLKGITCGIGAQSTSCSIPGLFSFQKYYMHTNDPGTATCLANTDNDAANQVCKSETLSSTPRWTGDSIGYRWNTYKYQ